MGSLRRKNLKQTFENADIKMLQRTEINFLFSYFFCQLCLKLSVLRRGKVALFSAVRSENV